MLDLSRWTATCPGMRVIVRREHPHPGATLDAFEIRDGYRYQAFTINTPSGQLAFLDARHRAHAPGRRSNPDRQGHRHRPTPLQARPRQRSQARARPHRRGPARPRAVDAPDRRAGPVPGRTQNPPPPAATHGRPHHPRPTQSLPAPGRAPALGPGPCQSVRPPADDPAPSLTANTTTPEPPPRSQRPRTPRRRFRPPGSENRDFQDHQQPIKALLKNRG